MNLSIIYNKYSNKEEWTQALIYPETNSIIGVSREHTQICNLVCDKIIPQFNQFDLLAIL